jgi:hypothetical protein
MKNGLYSLIAKKKKWQMIVHVHVTNVNRKETTLVRMCQLMTLASKVVPGT